MAALLSLLNGIERAYPDVSPQNRPPLPLGFEFVNVYNGRPDFSKQSASRAVVCPLLVCLHSLFISPELNYL